MKVAVLTLGCRVNQSESSIIEGTLKKSNVKLVKLKDNPDVCVINTCTVTARGDYSSRQMIRRAAKTGARVIVTGCYAQLKPDEIRRIDKDAEIVENDRKYNIINILTDKPKELNFGDYSRSRPFLKVQDGCDYNCTYCTVPLARGPSRSVPLKEVIRRAQHIEHNGFNEIVVTGIHLGTYGHDLPQKINLKFLLKEILEKTKRFRIRLSSIEANEIDDELIEIMQDERVCNHLHIPLQSGSGKILGLMRRRYSPENFRNKINTIAKQIDNVSIGTDVIVGFPGEGEDEFRDSSLLIQDLPFSYLHIFPYSVRPNTPASRMKEVPRQQEVRERIPQLKEVNDQKKKDFYAKQISRKLEVVVEEQVEENIILGTTSNYLKIRAYSRNYKKGSFAFIRPAKVADEILEGIMIR